MDAQHPAPVPSTPRSSGVGHSCQDWRGAGPGYAQAGPCPYAGGATAARAGPRTTSCATTRASTPGRRAGRRRAAWWPRLSSIPANCSRGSASSRPTAACRTRGGSPSTTNAAPPSSTSSRVNTRSLSPCGHLAPHQIPINFNALHPKSTTPVGRNILLQMWCKRNWADAGLLCVVRYGQHIGG